ncbi:MAG: glycosyl transferase family 1 [Halobacteriovorax sp.]|nr:glycosyl transferase family 1 [Halobacteriovorax sp.]|tara:strand:- start:28067 stop:29074 length:1008 start_codon:yes stop_codon:yes gene_type:complete
MSFFQKKIHYISDGANWVIKEIGESLNRELKDEGFELKESSLFCLNGINHFSSRYSAKKMFIKSPFVKNILTYFHGEDSDIKIINAIKKNQHNIEIIHTSCQITKEHLIRCGISEKKIVIIPIGIDVGFFSPVDEGKKKEIRKEFGIPEDATVIGSFQKDGNGWGEGLEPKLCKGPDHFCDAVELINKEKEVFVFLTGPSRGYVKKRLEESGIKYKHIFLDNYKDITKCFNLLDIYLVSSRLEGGPRAPMECHASGVPVVSTLVGQVPDMIEDGENGFIVEVGDTEAMAKSCLKILNNPELSKKFVQRGIETVKRFDYKVISSEYMEKLYKPLMK